MINFRPFLILTLALSLASPACTIEPAGGSSTSPPPKEVSRAADGVKLIAPDITLPEDSRAMLQPQYALGAESRLLVRFESLLSESANRLSNQRMGLRITPVDDASFELAKTGLRVCALRKNWMMLATWTFAFPMSRAGKWAQPGGDWDASVCSPAPTEPKREKETDARNLEFDLTDFAKLHLSERNRNFGVLLWVPDGGTIQVYGDDSSRYAPKVFWYVK